MTHLDRDASPKVEPARDLQLRLYREIGISAVAAALRCTSLPDPTRASRVEKTREPRYSHADVAA